VQGPRSISGARSAVLARTGPSHEALLALLEAAWRRSDAMLDLVAPGRLDRQPIGLRHPLIFYVGHLPAFAWNQVGRGCLGRKPMRADFDELFEFGIDPDEDDAREEPAAWPPLDEVLGYRDRVRAAIRAALPELEGRAGGQDPLAVRGRVLHLVLEHELMHHETLLYLFQELAPADKRAADWWKPPATGEAAAAPERAAVPAGRVTLGVAFDDVPFAWDNELPPRRVDVPAFEIATLPVTAGEFLGFVRDGGYERAELWDERGFAWIRRHGVAHPKDWVPAAGGFEVRAMFERLPLEAVTGWPASVTHAEASAYARWKGARLPTEPELLRAGWGDDARPYPWGDADPDERHGNFGFQHGSPTPVGSFPAAASPFGLHDVLGNGWEWTSTPFLAHEGFEPWVPSYAGYSRDFFDGDHYVMLGGSWATDGKLLRRSFRNWFRFNYPYPFTQFRLAWS